MRKRIISLALALIVLASAASFIPFKAKAEINYSCGENAVWSLDTETKTLTISGTGAVTGLQIRVAPWSDYSSYIHNVVVEEGITSVKCYLLNCTAARTVSFPSTLKELSFTAFYGTYSLTDINFPNGCCIEEYTNGGNATTNNLQTCPWYTSQPDGPIYFQDVLYCIKGTKNSFTDITVKDGTDYIFPYSFYGCNSLKSVTLPDSVTRIGYSAFRGCAALGSVKFSSSLEWIDKEAFLNCSALAELDMPESVYAIGVDAFTGTAWYDSQPDGLIYTGNVAYKYKGTMNPDEQITLRDGTLGIAGNAFYNCNIMRKLTVPDSLIYIGTNALNNTRLLTEFSVPDGFLYFDEQALGNTYFTAFYFPASVKAVGKGLFDYNSKIETVTYATGFKLDEISDAMFKMSKLKGDFYIPDGVKSVGSEAFGWCSSLTNVYFPRSVETIASDAFTLGSGKNLSDIVINCYKDSAAHTFAVDNGFKFVLLDDTAEDIDFAAINAIISKANSINRSLYTEDSLARLDAALSAVDTDASGLTQSTVDGWAEDINRAIEGLQMMPADYYSVDEAIEKAKALDRSLYTAESLARLDAALSAVTADAPITEQAKVNSWARGINSALKALEYLPADYSAVEAAVAEYNKLEREYYSSVTLTILDQRVAAVKYGLKINEQSRVDSFAASINEALASLEAASVTLRNEPHGVIVSATTKEIKKSTQLSVESRDPSDFEGSNFAVGGSIVSMNFYDIDLIYGGNVVQPDGTVSVKIRVPDGVNPKKCKVYHVSDDAVDPLVRFKNTIDGNYIAFETDHFSQYALIEVEPYALSLSITQMPYKTEYYTGEPLNMAGLEVTARMSDGTDKLLQDYEIVMLDMNTVGKKTVKLYFTFGEAKKSVTFDINVSLSPDFVRVTSAEIIAPAALKYGESSKLAVKVNDGAERYSVVWSSSDESIATVDKDGNVTATGRGTATITAEIINADGATVTATKEISCTMTLWQRIVRWFKGLFGAARLMKAIEH